MTQTANSQSETCYCNCGYRCGGPGRCELDPFECLKQEEGHYVKDCGHDFSGPVKEMVSPFGGGSTGISATCVNCGMTALQHDMWRGI